MIKSILIIFLSIFNIYLTISQVGIGTLTPNAKLDVNGDIAIGANVPANHQANGIVTVGNIIENTLGFGAALFLGSNGNYGMARAVNTTFRHPCVALAVEDGIGNKKILLYGYYRNDSWDWVVGKQLYLDVVKGELTQTPPNGIEAVIQVVGFATAANQIFFYPNSTTSSNFLINHKPVADFTATPNPVYKNNDVTFDATSSFEADPNDEITIYEWDFDGDGLFDVSSSDPIFIHTYTISGMYNVALKVTDSYDTTGIHTLVVEVKECDKVCDDSIACTEDILDPFYCTCSFVPRNDFCDDGLPCTEDVCNPISGNCEHTLVCDDGNACTIDYCIDDGQGGYTCFYEPIVCDDGLPCTFDTCDPVTGECVFTPINCDDGDPCTIDSCDPATGLCNNVYGCDDGDPCTYDYCEPGIGCIHEPFCDDGDPCTYDYCDPETGGCVSVPNCDDGNPCTIDYCEPGIGCIHEPVNCDDGDPLTYDSCDPSTGVCSNVYDDCDDGDPCTIDIFNASNGQCEYTPSCDDGDACTVDTCADDGMGGYTCTYDPIDCNDGSMNTLDLCDSDIGCYYTFNNNPVAGFSYTQTGNEITFDASSSIDPDEANGDYIALYEWDFDGDGSYDDSSTMASITFTFPTSGSYNVSLRVTDSQGLTGQYVALIEVL